jgi:hypothetical protein
MSVTMMTAFGSPRVTAAKSGTSRDGEAVGYTKSPQRSRCKYLDPNPSIHYTQGSIGPTGGH